MDSFSDIPSGFRLMLSEIPGLDADRLLMALTSEPSTSLRYNSRKTLLPDTKHFDDEMPVEWCSTGRYLSVRPQFTLDPSLHGGAYYVQEASSMIYREIIEHIIVREGWTNPRVLDLCAAPGGKTTAMIDALPDSACVIANEFMPKRAVILKENLQKWGFPNVAVTNSDTKYFGESGEIFDIVAVDAPCSGEGMMRKEPDARRQWSMSLIEKCAALQREIICNAIKALKPGGRLIYSTCTFNTIENEDNVKYIASLPGMEAEIIDLPGVPEECSDVSRRLGIENAYRFMPHFTRGEGLFIAVFKKIENATVAESDYTPYKSNGRKGKAGKADSKISKEIIQELEKKISREKMPTFTITSDAGNLRIVSESLHQLTLLLSSKIHYISCGVEAASIKGRDLHPLTPLALSGILKDDAYPAADLDKDDSLRYLRGETLNLSNDIPKGFVIVKYEGLPLGFVKNLGNRANNLYPSPWRIKNL